MRDVLNNGDGKVDGPVKMVDIRVRGPQKKGAAADANTVVTAIAAKAQCGIDVIQAKKRRKWTSTVGGRIKSHPSVVALTRPLLIAGSSTRTRPKVEGQTIMPPAAVQSADDVQMEVEVGDGKIVTLSQRQLLILLNRANSALAGVLAGINTQIWQTREHNDSPKREEYSLGMATEPHHVPPNHPTWVGGTKPNIVAIHWRSWEGVLPTTSIEVEVYQTRGGRMEAPRGSGDLSKSH
ncbi:hypothetical protein KM043_018238 [Ampulex compressa]|nr:hypothetical protein KM043_018238 [Ampulex compressa]